MTAETEVRDLDREQKRLESDVETVRTRAARDQQRIDSGAADVGFWTAAEARGRGVGTTAVGATSGSSQGTPIGRCVADLDGNGLLDLSGTVLSGLGINLP